MLSAFRCSAVICRLVLLSGLVWQATMAAAVGKKPKSLVVAPPPNNHRQMNDIFSGTLQSGVPVTLSGEVPGEVVASYEMVVQPGAVSVECLMSGGSGDG